MSAESAPSRIDMAGVARAAVAPAPAALITIWGFLVIVLLTNPIRPYTAGSWAVSDLLLLGILGGAIALVSQPVAAVVGVALGMAAAVTIQLFILAGQAVYQPVVAAAIDERTWTVAAAGALLVGVGAIALGYAVVRLTTSALRLRRGALGAPTALGSVPSPSSRVLIRDLVVGLSALVVAGLIVGVSLQAVARSAYVPAVDEVTMHVTLQEDGTIVSEPSTVPVGRTTIVIDGPPSEQRHFLSLVGPLTTSQLAAIERSELSGDPGCCYWNYFVPRTELTSPGTYAFVTLADVEPPPDIGQTEPWAQPISSARLFTVTADPTPRAPFTAAGGDGGTFLTVPVLAALGIEFWAASGAVALTLRRRRPLGASRVVVVAVVVGALSAAALAVLAMLAIDLTHNPF
jgi:hypothetical protein